MSTILILGALCAVALPTTTIVVASIARKTVLELARRDREARVEDRTIREDRLAKVEADLSRLKDKLSGYEIKAARRA